MATTPYAYDPGKDAQFDAFKAKYTFGQANAQADADLRRAKAGEDYQAALTDLDQRGIYGRRNLDTSMLARGVFASGETNRRHGELGSTLLQGRAAADQSNANTLGSISSDLQRAITSLDLDWESALSDALARISKPTSSGGGGGGVGDGGGGLTVTAPYIPPSTGYNTYQSPRQTMRPAPAPQPPPRPPTWAPGTRPGGYGPQPAPRPQPATPPRTPSPTSARRYT